MEIIEVNDLEKCIITGQPVRGGGRKVGITGYAIVYYVNPGVPFPPEKRAEVEKALIAKYPGQKLPIDTPAIAPVDPPAGTPAVKSKLKFDQEVVKSE